MPYHSVVVVTVSTDIMKEAQIVITSYDMMTRRQKELKEMNFGICIMVIDYEALTSECHSCVDHHKIQCTKSLSYKHL